jgi:hypothetical protein
MCSFSLRVLIRNQVSQFENVKISGKEAAPTMSFSNRITTLVTIRGSSVRLMESAHIHGCVQLWRRECVEARSSEVMVLERTQSTGR